MRLLLLSLAAIALYAQPPSGITPPPAAPVPTTPAPAPVSAPTPTVATLPNDWYGVFAQYDSTSHPRVTGGITEASKLSNMGLYSYNTWDVSVFMSKKTGALTYQSSPRTGFAMVLQNPALGPIHLVGFGNMGVATDGSNASFAYSGGGLAIWKIGQGKWSVFAGAHVLNTGALGGTTLVPEFGIGRTF